jgi:hypothetical protein
MFGNTATGVGYDYDSPVPEDEVAKDASRESRVRAYVELIRVGVDPMEAAQFCDMPFMSIVTQEAV